MTGSSGLAVWTAAGVFLCSMLLLFHRPLARLFRLLLRSSVGLAVLAALSQFEPLFGLRLGVNIMNALILGLLGAPGFGLLLLLQWALR